jgi:hypothetical protein
MSMAAGWYDDPFTDHLQRYWTGDSWTRETRQRTDVAPPMPLSGLPGSSAVSGPIAPPVPGAATSGQPVVRDWLIPSVLSIIFCAWPLSIPALVFAIKSNSAKKQGDMAAAARLSDRARLFVLLSVALGLVVWVYLAFVIMTTEIPVDPGTPVTPFGA